MINHLKYHVYVHHSCSQLMRKNKQTSSKIFTSWIVLSWPTSRSIISPLGLLKKIFEPPGRLLVICRVWLLSVNLIWSSSVIPADEILIWLTGIFSLSCNIEASYLSKTCSYCKLEKKWMMMKYDIWYSILI